MRKFKYKYCILDSKYLSISKVFALQNGHQRELFIPRTHDKDKKQPNKKNIAAGGCNSITANTNRSLRLLGKPT